MKKMKKREVPSVTIFKAMKEFTCRIKELSAE